MPVCSYPHVECKCLWRLEALDGSPEAGVMTVVSHSVCAVETEF